jgi:hypothetical protein
LFEITATTTLGGIFSSSTSVARVFHDVNKGNEDSPGTANPSYALVVHTHTDITDDVTAIEDRDWVAVDSASILSSASYTEWPNRVLSVMITTSEGITDGYPENAGTVTVDQRVSVKTAGFQGHHREFAAKISGKRYTSNWDGSAWTPWAEVITKSSTTSVTATTYTTLSTDSNILADNAAGVAVTLLAAATAGDGYELTIKRTGATGTITIDGDGTETIDGALTATLTTQYESLTLLCDGSNWHIT